MFKFSTNTILNSLTDENGINKLVATGSAGTGTLVIHRLGKFTGATTQKIYKRVGTAGSASSAVITADTLATVPNPNTTTAAATGVYRLKLYVKLFGNNDSNYANTEVFKGKPYVYEFYVSTATAAGVAAAAEAAVKKETKRFGGNGLSVTANGATITITTVGPDKEYHNITEAVLQKYDASASLTGGDYVDVAAGTLTACVNPFGNYTQIIKDLRLPTAENTTWTNPYKDELPALGTIYTQYIIYKCVDRGIMGGDAVGQTVTSVTAHSIWVPASLVSTFETALAKIGTPELYTAEYTTNATTVAGTDTIMGTADDAPNPGVSGESDVQD